LSAAIRIKTAPLQKPKTGEQAAASPARFFREYIEVLLAETAIFRDLRGSLF
jgi:hypothetical protein